MPRGRSSPFQYCFERLHCTFDALFSDSQLGNHFAIAFYVIRSQIIEQAPALAYNFQQPAAGPMIFFVGFEVLGEVRDALAK